MSPTVTCESRCRHHGVGNVTDVSECFLRRTVALVLVRRRKDRVDAQLAAALLEQAVDVDGLGVGLDGNVVRAVPVLLALMSARNSLRTSAASDFFFKK